MGEWLGGIIKALILLALTSLLTAALKGPIDNLASGDRLRAQIQLSPWVPQPFEKAETAQLKSANGKVQNPEVKMVRNPTSLAVGDSFQFARIIVTNEGSKNVTDPSIRVEGPYSPESVVILNGDDTLSYLDKPSQIKLKDMKPGDRVTVFIWNDYINSLTFPDHFKTYSSVGPFKNSFDWPTSQSNGYESGIGRFLDEWAFTIFFTLISLLVLFTLVYLAVQDSYFKALLKNERYFYSEKERFDANPEKFSPNFAEADKAAKNPRWPRQ